MRKQLDAFQTFMVLSIALIAIGVAAGIYLYVQSPAVECHPAVMILEPDSPEPLFVRDLFLCGPEFTVQGHDLSHAPRFPSMDEIPDSVSR